MSSKMILFYLICLNSLFFLISTKEDSKRTIFDEVQLKHLKLKNRIFRGAVGDQSFINGKISEEGFKLYDRLSKNDIGLIFTGYTMVSDYLQNDNYHTFRLDKDEYIPEFKKFIYSIKNIKYYHIKKCPLKHSYYSSHYFIFSFLLHAKKQYSMKQI